MTAKTVFRLSGVALVLGFVLLLVGQILQFQLPSLTDVGSRYTSSLLVPSYLLFWGGSLLQVIALPGFYARTSGKTGILGLVGFLLTMAGLIVIELGINLAEMTLFPQLAANAQALPALKSAASGFPPWILLFLIALFLGSLLWGIALIRGSTFTRGVGIVLTSGAIVSIASIVIPPLDPVGVLLAHAALAYGGLVLLREPVTSPSQAALA